MSTAPRQPAHDRRGCVAPSRHARRLAPVICILACTVSLAGDDPPGLAKPAEAAVALNQGVALDASSADGSVDQHAKERTAPAPPSREEVSPPATAVDPTRVVPGHAGAAPRTLTRTARNFETHTATPWYGTGLGALTIVLVIIGGAAWALRRWVPAARVQDSNLFRVIGRTALTPKHSVALVSVGRRLILVGLCGDRISTLGEISDAAEVAELMTRSSAPPRSKGGGFDELLAGQSVEFRPTGEAGDEIEPGGTSRAAARYREPLNDLLRRLRTLQVK